MVIKHTDKLRRTFLLNAVATAAAFIAGVIKPAGIWAATWNKSAFQARALADALKEIGATDAERSNDILIRAPDLAENGARVQLEVTSNIPGTRTIAIIAEKNPFPLVASFQFSNGAEAYISTYIKMGESANVRAVVNADGKVYTAAKEVRVTIGGCGA
ncbi:MAG TPA: thiosulfate oxidation carrier protein SoxY [Burkholderiales bacterium]|nr:thiosulfate oxidation carrier protein SoxY [Burkholderiales bacterium]